MKHILTIIITLFLATTADAQVVYKEVQRLTNEVIADKNKTNLERSVAIFKKDALEYMAVKSGELMRDSNSIILDTQAYGLYEFCFYYLAALDKAKSKAKKEQIRGVFREITLTTSRFKDEDYDVCYAYVNLKDKNNTTPFSLDTDWVLAVEQLKKQGYYF